MRDVLLVLAVFAACVVESVEASTIVRAVGLSRGWQATLRGVAAGLVVLAMIVAALGPALTIIPIDALRLVVGGLLLIFGLGWLRNAIVLREAVATDRWLRGDSHGRPSWGRDRWGLGQDR